MLILLCFGRTKIPAIFILLVAALPLPHNYSDKIIALCLRLVLVLSVHLRQLEAFDCLRQSSLLVRFQITSKLLETCDLQYLIRRSITVLYTWGDGTDGQLGHAKFETVNIYSM